MATGIRLCALPLVSLEEEPLRIASSKKSREVKGRDVGVSPQPTVLGIAKCLEYLRHVGSVAKKRRQ